MKLSLTSGKVTSYDKDMGDCIIYPTYGTADITSDVSIREFIQRPAHALRIGGFSADGALLDALFAMLPFQSEPRRVYDYVTITDVSDDGRSFKAHWKWGYENGDTEYTIAPKTIER